MFLHMYDRYLLWYCHVLNTFSNGGVINFETNFKLMNFAKLISNRNFQFLLFHVSTEPNQHGDFNSVSYCFGSVIETTTFIGFYDTYLCTDLSTDCRFMFKV